MRSNAALSSDEKLLLERYRAAPAAGKQAILGAALGQQSPVVSQMQYRPVNLFRF